MSAESSFAIRNSAPRFSDTLTTQGIHKDVVFGCDLVRAIENRFNSALDSVNSKTPGRRNDPENFNQMITELSVAIREQIAALGLGKKRWKDYLDDNALLKENPDVIVGVDTYRTANNLALNSKLPLHARSDDPPHFFDDVFIVKSAIEEENRCMAHWKHDIRNPLAVIVGYLDLLTDHIATPKTLLIEFEKICGMVNGLNHCNANEFIAYANKEALPSLHGHLKTLTSQAHSSCGAIPELTRELKGGIEQLAKRMKAFQEFIEGCSKSFEKLKVDDYLTRLPSEYQLDSWVEFNVHSEVDDRLILWVDGDDIARVFENLILNACDALKDVEGRPKKIQIHAHQVDDSRMKALIKSRGECPLKPLLTIKKVNSAIVIVEIQVSDTGSGIAPENRAKIFNDGFSTKGEGRGIGLASVHNIIEGYGGHIAIDEEKSDQGTCFSILLPTLKE